MLLFKDFKKNFTSSDANKKIVIFGAGTIGRIVALSLKNQGFNVDFFCDSDERKQESHINDLLVISPEKLSKFDPINTYIFIANQYFSAILPFLIKNNFKKIYKVLDLLESNDVEDLYEKIDMKFLFAKIAPLKLKRDIDFYNEMGFKEDYIRDNKLNLKTLDVQITEKCSLKCKDCSNLMQYYTRPQDSEIDILFKSIEKVMLAIDELQEFRVLGGDPFMNKDLHKIINKLIEYDKCKKIVVYTNAKFVPKGENLNCLKNEKVMLDITDYGTVSSAADSFVEMAKKENILYTRVKCNTWVDCGRIIPKTDKNHEELKSLFNNCCNSDLISLLHGKIYRCPFSANGVNLGAIPKNPEDEIDLMDDTISNDELREKIKKLCFEKDYLSACSFCNGRDYSTVNIPSAIQTPRNKVLKF